MEIKMALLANCRDNRVVFNCFGSAYLEPWSLVFTLVAIELVLLSPVALPIWLPILFSGIAALFKEQGALFFPFICLATAVKHRHRLGSIILASLVALTP